MYTTAPISWPIAKLLDFILGEHKLTRFNNAQLRAIVDLHCQRALQGVMGHTETKSFGDDSRIGLNPMQAKLIDGALKSRV